MGIALVTECVISAYKGDKGDTVLIAHFIREVIPRLIYSYTSSKFCLAAGVIIYKLLL